ncbi:MAG TPA: cupin domain-containing protein [Dehalococcoidia bacterium]
MSEVRVIRPHERDASTAQTPGMFRAEGAGAKTVGAEGIWVGHVTVDKGVRSGPHHHGALESVIYVISGRARFRYGDRLERVVEAQTGDFVFVPLYLVHQEINTSADEAVAMIVARSSQENVVINVEVEER